MKLDDDPFLARIYNQCRLMTFWETVDRQKRLMQKLWQKKHRKDRFFQYFRLYDHYGSFGSGPIRFRGHDTLRFGYYGDVGVIGEIRRRMRAIHPRIVVDLCGLCPTSGWNSVEVYMPFRMYGPNLRLRRLGVAVLRVILEWPLPTRKEARHAA